jgi:3-oxoacyl-[acyl-carrier protein] reductase
MSNNTDFAERVVVITGGSGGIGGAVARDCLSRGARVAVIDTATGDAPPGAAAYTADISDSRAVDAVFEKIIADHGKIDDFVHAAGVSMAKETKRRVAPQLNKRFDEAYPVIDGVLSTEDEEWHRLIGINLDGTFFCLRASLRAMAPARQGRIVLISSNAGLVGEPGTGAYSASKGGAQLLMQAAAAEVVGLGIRINAVAPGPTMTSLVRDSSAAGQNFLVRVPARRVAEPEEISRAVLFLLEDPGFMIGETINVNGGILVR